MSDAVQFDSLPPGDCGLAGARPDPDLDAAGYAEQEYAVSGLAVSYSADGPGLPADGRWSLRPGDEAAFTTRVVIRRPRDEASFSGTVVVEWLNVSSGRDAAPGWTYQAEEILRRGHLWVGVSAQFGGVEGGLSSVSVGDLDSPGLKGTDPERYAALSHPGDVYAYDLFTRVASGLSGAGPLADVDVSARLAMGQSQSAFCLTAYVNGVQPLTGVFDGFLIHSRGGAAAPLGRAGEGLRMDEVVAGPPTWLRTDLDVPVLVMQTETDLFGRLGYLPARQPDHDRLRVWEAAGTAHADKYLIGEFEDFLGCAEPVNRGQQSFVLKSALRHLDHWARTGGAPPSFPALATTADGFVTDDLGNATGGVRTPAVEAPVEVLSGSSAPDASTICGLFGTTAPADRELIEERYRSPEAYLSAYEAAVATSIRDGVVLVEDRQAILAEARPDLIPGADLSPPR